MNIKGMLIEYEEVEVSRIPMREFIEEVNWKRNNNMRNI